VMKTKIKEPRESKLNYPLRPLKRPVFGGVGSVLFSLERAAIQRVQGGCKKLNFLWKAITKKQGRHAAFSGSEKLKIGGKSVRRKTLGKKTLLRLS